MKHYTVKPSTIRLECSSICQLRCPCCVIERNAEEQVIGNGFLKLSHFKQVVDQNDWVAGIELSNRGEIFLNPEFLDIMRYADHQGVALFAGNGVNLNHVEDDVLEGLIKYRFRDMTCSIDGATDETYQNYRVGGDLNRVIDNIRKINFFKGLYRSELPILTWQFVIFGHNEHEISHARKMAADLNMNFRLKLSWDPNFSPVRDKGLVARELESGSTSIEEFRQEYGVEYMQELMCSQLWVEPTINWDGKVLGCCANYWAEFGTNAFTDGLLAAINSEKMRYARGMLLGEKPARAEIACTQCRQYRTMKANNKWMKPPHIPQERRTKSVIGPVVNVLPAQSKKDLCGSVGQEVMAVMKGNVSGSLVSVIIPAYNCARFIREAVESALDQLDPPPEVIVVDDGSTDETHLVLTPHLDQIRYVYQENQGQSVARNLGLEIAQGEYVVFLDADDILMPGILAEEMACLEAHPSLGMIQGGTRVVDHKGETLRDEQLWHESPTLDLETCVREHPVQLGAMMIRRDWLDRIGGFDPDLRYAQDVDLLLRLSLAGCEMRWLHRQALCYRQHESNLTRNAVEQADSLETVLDKFFAQPDIPERILRLENSVRFHTLVWSAWRMYSMGQTDHIVDCLRRSLEYTPYTLEQTVVTWAQQFAKEQSFVGQESEYDLWVPYLQAATPDTLPLARLENMFRWWMNVWRHYVEDDERRIDGLSTYRELGTRKLIVLAQSSLLMTPVERMVKIAALFWKDIQTMGLVSPSQAYEVTKLYLTIFGQASLAHRWSVARHALGRAVRYSAHPRAFGAWFRFVHSALNYFLCKSDGL